MGLQRCGQRPSGVATVPEQDIRAFRAIRRTVPCRRSNSAIRDDDQVLQGLPVLTLRRFTSEHLEWARCTRKRQADGTQKTSRVRHIMDIAGITLVGVNAENGQKLLYSIIFFVIILLLQRGLRLALQQLYLRRPSSRLRFWMIQGTNIATLLLFVLGFLSIWFDDPTRLATGIGLVSAGVAFALQQVITAIAGYIVILRGEMFTVGDRITLGGVRGDVIGIRLTQTTIMEMGQPPAVQNADPAMWVRSRQYTGRIVNVSMLRYSPNRSTTIRGNSRTSGKR